MKEQGYAAYNNPPVTNNEPPAPETVADLPKSCVLSDEDFIGPHDTEDLSDLPGSASRKSVRFDESSTTSDRGRYASACKPYAEEKQRENDDGDDEEFQKHNKENTSK